MSDQPQTPSDEAPGAEPADSPAAVDSSTPTGTPGSRKGLIIALGIIVVVLAAYSYDTFVAPGAVQAGFDKVAEAKLQSLNENQPMSSEDIHEVLGKKPADAYEVEGLYEEVFHFTGGMLINSHKLYVVYQKQGDQWTLVRPSLFSVDSPDREATIVESDPALADNDDAEMSMGGPAGGGEDEAPAAEETAAPPAETTPTEADELDEADEATAGDEAAEAEATENEPKTE